jgi:hypothetical protein
MKDTKQNLKDLNYLWDNYSMYSYNPEVRVASKKVDSEKCKKAACNLKNAVDFLYTDKNGNPLKSQEYMGGSANLGSIKIGLSKIGSKNFLTDNGELFSLLNKSRGVSKTEFIKLLKNANSDYNLTVINNELCSEIDDPASLADCYRNMTNVILKIKTFGGIK